MFIFIPRKFTAYLVMILIATRTVLAQEEVESWLTDLEPQYGHDESIRVLSGQGTIAGGYIDNLSQERDGAIWTFSNGSWSEAELEGIMIDVDDYEVKVDALSSDGSIAGGFAEKSDPNSTGTISRAVIWTFSNNGWSKARALDFIPQKQNDESSVSSLSEDGETAAGWAETSLSPHTAKSFSPRAVIWTSSDRWDTIDLNKDLGTLTTDNSGTSEVNALSGDGSIAAGWAETSSSEEHATIWTTSNRWKTIDLKQDLGTLKNHLESRVEVLSRDGKTAGGWSGQYAHRKAVIWTTKDRWKTVDSTKDLGTLQNNNSGYSEVCALSADGTIAGGWADSNNGNHRATLWSGENFSTKTDLGSGKINALSDDATIAGGWSRNGSGKQRATLWRLSYPTSTNSVLFATIDVANTRASVAKLASDRFATIEQQRLGLGRLQDGCTPAAGKSCYRLGGGASGFNGATDVYTEAAFGHAFSDNLASGVTITNTFSGLGNLPGDLKRDGINPGAGIWAKWREATQDGHWYLRSTAAANRAKIKRSRSGFSGIEPGTGTSTSTGWSVATELGRVHEMTSTTNISYYGGMRHSNVRLSGYTETRAPGFPFSWSSATSSRTAAYVGARYRMSFGKGLYWSIRAELERDLNHQDPTLTAQSEVNILNRTYPSDFAHTRGTLSASVSYAFSDAAMLSLSPFLGHSATDKTVYGAMLRISGDF